jgi:hypothetical protein
MEQIQIDRELFLDTLKLLYLLEKEHEYSKIGKKIGVITNKMEKQL